MKKLKKPKIEYKFGNELFEIILAVLVLGFCFSFRDWGYELFDIGIGLYNLFKSIIIVGFSVGVHEVAHRWLAKKYFAKVRYKLWKTGIFAALILVFLTNGYIVFAAPGVVAISTIYLFRPGAALPGGYPKHLGPFDRAKIALIGPMSNLALAFFAKGFFEFSPWLMNKLLFVNLSLAFFNMFPFFILFPVLFSKIFPHKIRRFTYKHDIPYLEGEHILFGSLIMWGFSFIFLCFSIGFLMFLNVGLALILSIISASILFLFYWYYIQIGGPKGFKPSPDSIWWK